MSSVSVLVFSSREGPGRDGQGGHDEALVERGVVSEDAARVVVFEFHKLREERRVLSCPHLECVARVRVDPLHEHHHLKLRVGEVRLQMGRTELARPSERGEWGGKETGAAGSLTIGVVDLRQVLHHVTVGSYLSKATEKRIL